MLANLPRPRLSEIMRDLHIEKFTADTVTDVEIIAQQLDTIRKTNTASNINQTEEGLAAVASGVFDVDGRLVATIALQAPLVRMTADQIESHRKSVLRAAKNATALLSGEEVVR